MEKTCENCRWFAYYLPPYWEEIDDADADWPAGCYIPAENLPLSMRGMAMAEKTNVVAAWTGCPTWEEVIEDTWKESGESLD